MAGHGTLGNRRTETRKTPRSLRDRPELGRSSCRGGSGAPCPGCPSSPHLPREGAPPAHGAAPALRPPPPPPSGSRSLTPDPVLLLQRRLLVSLSPSALSPWPAEGCCVAPSSVCDQELLAGRAQRQLTDVTLFLSLSLSKLIKKKNILKKPGQCCSVVGVHLEPGGHGPFNSRSGPRPRLQPRCPARGEQEVADP